MSFIQSKKHPTLSRSALASALLLALPVAAQPASSQNEPGKMAEVKVTADAIEPEFIAEKASSAKQVKPLVF